MATYSMLPAAQLLGFHKRYEGCGPIERVAKRYHRAYTYTPQHQKPKRAGWVKMTAVAVALVVVGVLR